MRPPSQRTYGKKKAPGAAAAGVVFGSSSGPLVDITSAIENLSLADANQLSSLRDSQGLSSHVRDGDSLSPSIHDGSSLSSPIRDGGRLSPSIRDGASVSPSVRDNSNVGTSDSTTGQDGPFEHGNGGSTLVATGPLTSSNVPAHLGHLNSLIQAYVTDCGRPSQMKKWSEIIDKDVTIVKIAEASYAEVYRVTTDHGSSILKVMQLKMPSNSESMEAYWTVDIEQIISEIRIMNAMTEIPGFVSFKDAHLVQGKPGVGLSTAWDKYLEQFVGVDPENPNPTSYFPSPELYSDESLFLAIELGDAGGVLEDFRIDNLDKFWDIFLGVILALSRAELESEFEHRDLHENNICISISEPSEAAKNLPEGVRYGRSGVEVTLIDYGLSRAKLPTGETMFYDLETDLAVFRGQDGEVQYDTYRRMRTHLFTGGRNMFKRNWHSEESRAKNDGHTWAEYIPYTNVLWIKYLFGWLHGHYQKSILPKKDYGFYSIPGISDLRHKFDLRTRQGFESAADLLIFALDQGWITNDQIDESGVDTTILSNYTILRE